MTSISCTAKQDEVTDIDDPLVPLDSIPWDVVNWNSLIRDYRTFQGYGFDSKSSIDAIVNRFERDFRRRIHVALQGQRKAKN